MSIYLPEGVSQDDIDRAYGWTEEAQLAEEAEIHAYKTYIKSDDDKRVVALIEQMHSLAENNPEKFEFALGQMYDAFNVEDSQGIFSDLITQQFSDEYVAEIAATKMQAEEDAYYAQQPF